MAYTKYKEDFAVNKYYKGFKFSEPTSIAIGSFDGMHLGHQELLNVLNKSEFNSAVLTFSYIKKSSHINSSILTTLQDREELSCKYGIHNFYYLDFTDELKNTTAEDFITDYLEKANIKEIIIGEDFRFGTKGTGTYKLLEKLLPQVKVIVCSMIDNDQGNKISTTEIIKLIVSGEIETANRYLGREYKISGRVVMGYQNGHKLGFPTANIQLSNQYTIPRNGVYATYLTIDGHRYLSMTNIGTHPTIDELKNATIETHIFDYNEEIYNKEVSLEFLSFIRDENKFSNIDDLKAELSRNKEVIISRYKKQK